MVCNSSSTRNSLRKVLNTITSLCVPLLVVGAASALLFVGEPGAQQGRDAMPIAFKQAALRRHGPGVLHRRIDNATATSDNWAGYVVTGPQGSVTNAAGSWVVPSVVCSGTSAYASFWGGIDGWGSNTVEQTGTDSDCDGDTPSYYAWYEFYPDFSYTISEYSKAGVCTAYCVEPGDTISVTVDPSSVENKKGPAHGGQEFTLTISDSKWRSPFTVSHSVNGAKQVSAEFITETDYGCKTASHYCYLSNFGTANYSGASTTVSGANHTLDFFTSSLLQVTMVDAGTDNSMAVPSGISAGDFSVTWMNAGP
jgi:hypothetical protein